jgi:hypothetical protein
MKNIPNRSTIAANAANGDGALPLVILGALVILIVVVLVGVFAVRTIATTWRSADQHAPTGGDQHDVGVDHVGGDDDQHGVDHAKDDGRGAPTITKVNDSELNALLSAEGELSETAYDGKLALLPIDWAESRGSAYAYTDCQAIYFVKTEYERDNWPLNLETLRHEVAHVVVGCEHGHDEAWKREFDRLMALAPNLHGVGDRASD